MGLGGACRHGRGDSKPDRLRDRDRRALAPEGLSRAAVAVPVPAWLGLGGGMARAPGGSMAGSDGLGARGPGTSL